FGITHHRSARAEPGTWPKASRRRRELDFRARRPRSQDDGRQCVRHPARLVYASRLRADRDTEPFPYDDNRFGIPKRDDLHFVVLHKRLAAVDAFTSATTTGIRSLPVAHTHRLSRFV